MAGRRTFTNEFKLQVIREYLGGMMSRAALARQYDIAPEQIKARQRWYEEGRLTDQPGGDPGLYRRIAELERMVGRLTMENDLIKKPTPGRAGSQAHVLPRSSADPADPDRMGVRGDRTCPAQLLLPTGGAEEAGRRGCRHPGPVGGAGAGVSPIWLPSDDGALESGWLARQP